MFRVCISKVKVQQDWVGYLKLQADSGAPFPADTLRLNVERIHNDAFDCRIRQVCHLDSIYSPVVRQ